MFKQILLIFILIVLFYFIIKEIFISTHKIFISEEIVKYKSHLLKLILEKIKKLNDVIFLTNNEMRNKTLKK